MSKSGFGGSISGISTDREDVRLQNDMRIFEREMLGGMTHPGKGIDERREPRTSSPTRVRTAIDDMDAVTAREVAHAENRVRELLHTAEGGEEEDNAVTVEAVIIIRRLRRQLREATDANDAMQEEVASQAARMQTWSIRLQGLESKVDEMLEERAEHVAKIGDLQRRLTTAAAERDANRVVFEERLTAAHTAAEAASTSEQVAKERLVRVEQEAAASERVALLRCERLEELLRIQRRLEEQGREETERDRLAQAQHALRERGHERAARAAEARAAAESELHLFDSLERAVRDAARDHVALETKNHNREERERLKKQIEHIHSVISRRSADLETKCEALENERDKLQDQLSHRPPLRKVREIERKCESLSAKLAVLRRNAKACSCKAAQQTAEDERAVDGYRKLLDRAARPPSPSALRKRMEDDRILAAHTPLSLSALAANSPAQGPQRVMAAATRLLLDIAAEVQVAQLLDDDNPPIGSWLTREVRALCSAQTALRPLQTLANHVAELLEELQRADFLPRTDTEDGNRLSARDHALPGLGGGSGILGIRDTSNRGGGRLSLEQQTALLPELRARIQLLTNSNSAAIDALRRVLLEVQRLVGASGMGDTIEKTRCAVKAQLRLFSVNHRLRSLLGASPDASEEHLLAVVERWMERTSK